MEKKTSVLIVAAEASADLHAAQVVRRLKEMPDLSFFGIGGPHLAAEGLDAVGRAEDLAVMGLWEVLANFRKIKGAYDRLLRRTDRGRPAVALLLDYPGFNFRLMKALRRRHIPVLYYICPQVWAWHPERVRTLSRYTDRRLVIFPFEVDFYREHGVETRFVGHPLLDILPAPLKELPSGPPKIGIFPGSRNSEIQRILAVFIPALEKIRAHRPDAEFLLFPAPTLPADALLARFPPNMGVRIAQGGRHEILQTLHLALMVSGTITLEAALLGVPGIVAYRMNPLTYALLKRRVKVDHISIVNILLKKRVFPEFVQREANPEALAREALRLLDSPGEQARIRAEVLALRPLLRHGSASVVAQEVREYIRS